MRIEGTLTKWNDERGFGFITPIQGGSEIFVHISVFPRGGQRPSVGEHVTFEIETKVGKKKAKNLIYPNRIASLSVRRYSPRGRSEKQTSLFTPLVTLLVFIALGAYGYDKFSHHAGSWPVTSANEVDSLSFQCDGRTHCSQMTSCQEAKFFLKNCPGTKMDGNNDGVPCEKQWCN